MTILPTEAASSWQAKCCYLAAALLALASAGTNALYGWGKGTDTATSLVWLSVSVAVSVVFAFSWPALILSIDRQQWARAMLVFIALLLTGTYSISAALGSAMGGRANAAIEEKDTTDKRAKAQAAYDAAKSELANLKPARSVAELLAMRDGWVRAYKREPWILEPELARAKRRAELEQKIERAAGELKATRPAQVANSDALALAVFVQGLGINVDADRMNNLLTLLAVICIECGGGLSLAVGLALAQPTDKTAPTVELNHAEPDQRRSEEPEPAKPCAIDGGSVLHLAVVGPLKRPVQNQKKNQRKNRSKKHNRDQVANAIVNQLRNHKTVASSERQLAQMIGAKRSTVRRAMLGLAASGAVHPSSSRAGTIVALAA
jgi:hypothetical protein